MTLLEGENMNLSTVKPPPTPASITYAVSTGGTIILTRNTTGLVTGVTVKDAHGNMWAYLKV